MSKFQIYQRQGSGEQCWCWRLLAGDGRTIAESDAPFLKQDVRDPIKEIQSLVNEQDFQGLRISEDGKSWSLENDKGDIKVSGEIDVSKADAKSHLEDICKEFKGAEITWENEEDDPSHPAKTSDTTQTKGVPGT